MKISVHVGGTGSTLTARLAAAAHRKLAVANRGISAASSYSGIDAAASPDVANAGPPDAPNPFDTAPPDMSSISDALFDPEIL